MRNILWTRTHATSQNAPRFLLPQDWNSIGHLVPPFLAAMLYFPRAFLALELWRVSVANCGLGMDPVTPILRFTGQVTHTNMSGHVDLDASL